MSDATLTEPPESPAAANGSGPPVEDGWLRDGRGRLYIGRPAGGKGVVFRRGEETIAEALERDAAGVPAGADKRPRARSRRPKLPPAPTHVDLKALEQLLEEALKAPAMPCAMLGDEWAANHFTTQAPYLARNLVLAAEHNPWLRRKLEGMASGQDAAVKLLAVAGLAGALFGYAVPPVVWWLNLPVPPKAREMFAIPPARQPEPEPRAPGAATAAPTAVAA